MRRGMAYFHLGEYKLSIDDLRKSILYGTEIQNTTEPNIDLEKIKLYLNRAEKGFDEQNKALLKRKQALQKAFTSTESSLNTSPPKEPQQNGGWKKRDILLLVTCICLVAMAVFIAYLQNSTHVI